MLKVRKCSFTRVLLGICIYLIVMYYTRMLLYDQIHSAVEPEMPATPPIEIHEAIRVRFPVNPSYQRETKELPAYSTRNSSALHPTLAVESAYPANRLILAVL